MTNVIDRSNDPIINGILLSARIYSHSFPSRIRNLWNKNAYYSIDEFSRILQSIDTTDLFNKYLQLRFNSATEPQLTQYSYDDLKEKIGGCIEIYLKEMPQNTVLVLFSMLRSNLTVKLLYAPDQYRANFALNSQHLHKSPIRDLVIDNEEIDEINVDKHEPKYRWLLKLVSFDWTVGKKIVVSKVNFHQKSAEDEIYALFAFGKNTKYLEEKHRYILNTCAKEIECILMYYQFQRVLNKNFDMARLGVAYHKAAHELKGDIFNIAEAFTRIERIDYDKKQSLIGTISLARKMADNCCEIVHELLPDKPTGTEFKETKAVNVNEFVREFVENSNEENKKIQGVIEFKSIKSIIPYINIRPIHLSRILSNLVSNAKYFLTECGRNDGQVIIEITIENQYKGNRQIHIWCHDTAGGIRAFNSPYIFEEQYTTKDNGTGYGLSICLDFARRFGGSIELYETIIGIGSTFLIRIPLPQDISEDLHGREDFAAQRS